ncbi:MAG: inositol phosphate phosphatase SopB [Burkholderiaceae bacterium]
MKFSTMMLCLANLPGPWPAKKDKAPQPSPQPEVKRAWSAPLLGQLPATPAKSTKPLRSLSLPLRLSAKPTRISMNMVGDSEEVATTRAEAMSLGRSIVERLPADEASSALFVRQNTTIANALELLGGDGGTLLESPDGGRASLQAAITDLKQLAAELGLDPSKGIGALDGEMRQIVDDFAQQMQAHLTAYQAHRSANPNPFSARQVFHAKSIATESAIHVIDLQLADASELTQDQQTMFRNARGQLRSRMLEFRDEPDTQPLRNREIRRLMGSDGIDKGLNKCAATSVLQGLGKDPDFLDPERMPPLPKSDPGVREEGMMQLYLQALFKKSGLAPPDLPTALHHGRMAALNSQPWHVIDKTVPYIDRSGRTIDVKSTIVPQSRLHSTFKDMGGGGLNCHMTTEFRHAVNLAVNRLEVPNKQGRLRKRFQAIRHGTLTAYDISGSHLKTMSDAELHKLIVNLLPLSKWEPRGENTLARMRDDKKYRNECADLMRAAAADRRAKDIATAALVNDPEKLKAALKGRPVELSLTSISLLTPDVFRSLLAKGKSKGVNERRMWEDQLGAWERLQQGEQMLMVDAPDGRTVPVQVRIRVDAFNFGVNRIAFHTQNAQLARLTGWAKSDEQNAKAMSTLLGDAAHDPDAALGGQVGRWLERNDAITGDARHVRTLARQIQRLWNDKSYRSGKTEPYKLVKRLAVLGSMIGLDICINCKSAKDRSAQCLSEAELLALQIDLDDEIPEPDADASPRTKANLFEMSTQGGNFELQQLNTGAAGFKLVGVPALSEQLASDDARTYFKYFRGLSKYFGS